MFNFFQHSTYSQGNHGMLQWSYVAMGKRFYCEMVNGILFKW